MIGTGSDERPQLSVILATPYEFETLHLVLEYLRAQTIRNRIELIVVGSTPERFRVDVSLLEGFCGYRVVHVGEIKSLNIPRVAGIRAATAPIVALTEEHCFPSPRWAEALVAAHRGDWAAVGPAVGIANPGTYISWANHVIQYFPWTVLAPGGEQEDVPGHNSSYKRARLLEYDRELEEIFIAEARLHADLRRRGHRLYMAEEATTFHVYITKLKPYVEENYYIGRQFAANRSQSWSVGRRWISGLGSPLVPLLRTVRALRRLRQLEWFADLVPGILPSLWLGLGASALGEMVGYCFGMGSAAGKTLDLDFKRYRFVTSAEKERIWGGRPLAFETQPPAVALKSAER